MAAIKTNEIGLCQAELEAYHKDSLDYLVEVPASIDWNVKQVNPQYIGKAMREEHEEEIAQSLKLYPRGEASLESVFHFGKHKGKQLEDLIQDHPGYLTWLAEKEVISFDEEAYQKLEEAGII